MFLENKAHLQQDIFGIESQLSEAKRKKLHTSSEAYFYELIYSNINEKDFAPLFSNCGRRFDSTLNQPV